MKQARDRYLYKQNANFYFRMRVPADLIDTLGRRELKHALRTQSIRTALVRCRIFSVAVLELFERTRRKAVLMEQDVREPIRRWFWAEFNRIQSDNAGYLGRHDFDPAFEADCWEEKARGLQAKIARNDFDRHTLSAASRILRSQGADVSALSQYQLSLVQAVYLRAEAEKARITSNLVIGNYAATGVMDPMFQRPVGEIAYGLTAAAPSLGELKSDFLCEKGKEGLAPKTLRDYERATGRFVEFFGDQLRFDKIGRPEIREFRDFLINLPANLPVSANPNGRNIREVAAAASDIPPIAPGTAKKYFGMVQNFLTWACDENDISKSPAEGIRVSSASNHSNGRDPYSNDELSRLFESPLFAGCHSASRRSWPGELLLYDGRFWIPLLALCSGARLGELVQLTREDIGESNGIRYIDINDKDDFKVLKSRSSARRIPVHPVLEGLGFLDWCDDLKAEPKDRIFEEIKIGSDGYPSHNFSKWYGRYTNHIGLTNERTTFHSFRHNFKDALVQSGASDAIVKSLMGHADGSVTASYGSALPVSVLDKAMRAAKFPVDLTHLVRFEKTKAR